MNRDTLTHFLDEYLSVNEIDDFSYNSLQFEGCSDVKRVGFAVDAGIQTFLQAAEAEVDLLVVHHGLFWKKQNPVITGVHKKRLQVLWENDMSLYGVHLPLDMHDKVGNNTGLIALVGADVVDRMSPYGKNFIGAVGELQSSMTVQDIADRLAKELNSEMKTIDVSNGAVKRVAAMSGACSRADLYEAAERGVELLITGEPSEMYHDAHDYGISVLFAGHHASETVGIKLLKERFAREYPELESLFIQHPTNM